MGKGAAVAGRSVAELGLIASGFVLTVAIIAVDRDVRPGVLLLLGLVLILSQRVGWQRRPRFLRLPSLAIGAGLVVLMLYQYLGR